MCSNNKNNRIRGLFGFALALLFFSAATAAQTTQFVLAVDADSDAASGCGFPEGAPLLQGIEQVFITTVEAAGGAAQVTALQRRVCAGGAFDAAETYDAGGWPVGLGPGGVFVVESSLLTAYLPAGINLRAFALALDGSGGADVTAAFQLSLAETQPQPGAIAIPVGTWLLPALVLLVGLLAWWRGGDVLRYRVLPVLAVMSVAGWVWAQGLVRDGQVDDWVDSSPVVTDPEGDAPPAIDLVAVYARQQGGDLFLRFDTAARPDDPDDPDDPDWLSLQLIPLPDRSIPANVRLLAPLQAVSTVPGDTIEFTLASAPTGALLAGGVQVDWTPLPGQAGPHPFTVTATSDSGGTASTSFTVTVVHENRPPRLAPQADASLVQGGLFSRTLSATDQDPGDSVSLGLVSGPAGMALAGAQLDWDTTAQPIGDYPVTVRATDSEGLFDERGFIVRVLPRQPPVALDDYYRVVVGETLSVGAAGVLANDLSPYARPLAANLEEQPTLGTLAAFGGDGAFTYQAPAEQPERPFELVRRWTSPVHPNVYTGFVAGDVNGDGVPDIVYHDQFAGFIARDGATGDVLWSRPVSFFCQHLSLPLLADIDDDGQLELVATDCGPNPSDSASNVLVVLDASSGAELRRAHIAEVFDDVSPAPRHLINGFGAASAGITLARLAGNGPPRLLFKQEIAASAGFHTRASDGANVSAGCAGVTGDPADFGQACRVLLIIDPVTLAKETTLVAPLADTFTNVETSKASGIYHGSYLAPVVADLDGDGQVEIVSGGDVWRQVDGAWKLAWSSVRTPASTAVADLDGDGRLEVIQSYTFEPALLSGGAPGLPCGIFIYGADGDLRRAISLPSCARTGNLTVADVDGDGAPEILLTRAGSVHAVRADGRSLWTFDVPDTTATLPSLEAEIGRDARAIQPKDQRTGGAFIVVYDLDGDGAAEVVVNTQAGLWVLDGRDGEPRAVYGLSGYQGLFNIPVTLAVLDLDNDGSSHLVVRGGCPYLLFQDELEYCNGQISVLSPAQGAWLPGPRSFPQGNYLEGQIDDANALQFNPPVGGLFRTPRQRGTVEDPRLISADTFTYTASDGQQVSTPATVAIQIDPPNRPPRLTNSLSANFTTGSAFQLQLLAVDPDQGDTLTFSRGENSLFCAGLPPQVDASTGVLTCNAPSANPEPAVVAIRVTDSFGAFDEQTLRFFRLGAAVTLPSLLGLSEGEASDALASAGLRLGEVVTFFSPAPAGTVIGQTPLPGAGSNVNALVDLTVSLGPQPTAVPSLVGRSLDRSRELLTGLGFEFDVIAEIADGVAGGQVLAQSPAAGALLLPGVDPILLTVAAGAVPPGDIAGIVIEPGAAARVVGDRLPLRAFVEFADGSSADVTLNAVWTSSDNTVVAIDGVGMARVLGAGTATITATLGAFNAASTLQIASQVADVTPPTASITAPSEDDRITAPVDIIGTASDPNFHRYEVATTPAGEARWMVVAEGTSAVTDGVLGQFDPGKLPNGPHELRLRVFDRGGNVAEDFRWVLVAGERKIGQFSLVYTDLSVDLLGLPITVTRHYDTTDKGQGEFGVGWRLGFNSLRIRPNRVLGTAWVRNQTGANSTLEPRAPHWVSVTLPDGTVEVFDLQLSPTGGLGVLQTTRVVGFAPRAGARGTLEALDNPDLVVLNQGFFNVLVDDATLEVYDPQLFRYTTPQGVQLIVHRRDGVRSITDANGNTITIGPDGIVHSSGQGVPFERDAEGRITAITDLNGNVQTYAYDANGDLVRHTNAAGGASRYVYNRNHDLLEVHDAEGVRVSRHEYDNAGRLVGITDAAGNTIEVQHDDGNDREIVINRLGHLTRVSYDDDGNVTRTETPVTIDGVLVNAVRQLQYDDTGNLLESIEPDGRRILWTYTSALPTQQVVDADGLALITSYAYNGNDDITEIVDPAGNSVHFAYTGSGDLVGLDLLGAGPVVATVDGRGLATERVDAAGTRTVMTRDANGRIVREEIIDADARLLRRIDFGYDANGNKTSETLRRTDEGVAVLLTTHYSYDAMNRLVATTDPAGGTWRTEYDANGRVAAEVDALGRRVTHYYDVLGRRTRTVLPDGTFRRWDYDAEGNVIASTDFAGRVTAYEYDEMNRLVREISPDGTSTRTLFSPGGLVTATIDPRGARTDYEYDSAGRRVAALLPEVLDGSDGQLRRGEERIALDGAGRPMSRTDANGNTVVFGYDAEGRLARIEHPDGSVTEQHWDAVGRLVRVTNEEGEQIHREYDGLGRLVAVTGQMGEMVYDYDEAGNLVRQTDALGRATRYRYDLLNRLVEREFPGGERERYAYDAVDNLVAWIDGLDRVTAFFHNDVNQLVRKVLPDGSEVVYSYQDDGQRAALVEPRGTTAYEYDARGRLRRIEHPDGDVVDYDYDGNGNLLAITAPAGSTQYAYDALDRLVEVVAPEGASSYEYDLVGNPLRQTRWNGVTTVMAYDGRNRILSLQHRDIGDVLLQSWATLWTPSGRLQRMEEGDGSVEVYSYDARGQLTGVVRTGIGAYTASFSYDAVGNRTQATRDVVTTAYSYDVNDRLLTDGTTAYQWNANGNLIRSTSGGQATEYRYDPAQRLLAIERGGQALGRYRYDDDGNRVRASNAQGVTQFLVDTRNNTGFSQVLEERNLAGDLRARYTYGLGALSQVRDGSSSSLLRDPLHSVRALAAADGSISDQYRYDAFGNTEIAQGATINPYRYRGDRLDTESGRYHLRARQYNPAVGRFEARDPFVGRPEDPVSRHRYLYAHNDPINNVDPSGRESLATLIFGMGMRDTIGKMDAVVKAQAYCRANTTLRVVGYTHLFASVAAQVMQSWFDVGKVGLQVVAVNPVALKGSDIKSVELRYQPPLDGKIAIGFNDSSLSKSITFGASGISLGLNNTLAEAPIDACGMKDLAKAKIKAGGKIGVNLHGKAKFSTSLSGEVEWLSFGRYELTFIEIGYDLSKLSDLDRARELKLIRNKGVPP